MKRYRFIFLSIPVMLVFYLTLFSSYANADYLDNWHWNNSSQYGNASNNLTKTNNTFFSLGNSGYILTSTDGVAWTSWTTGSTYQLFGITYANNTFITVGDHGTILTSPDGVAWTLRTSGTTEQLNSIAYGNNTFAAVGETGMILTSPDGAVWTAQNSGTANALYSIAYGNNTFIAVGKDGIILTSTDGIAWTSGTSGTANNLYSVAYANNSFVAVGKVSTILTSPNGTVWTAQSSPVANDLYAVVYNNNTKTFIALSGYGAILQSDSICTSSLSPALILNLPIITFNNNYLWADLQYLQGSTGDAMFKVTNSGVVSNPADYSNCQVSTLVANNSGYKLHVPEINYNNTFYSADLEYVPTTDGETWFRLTGAQLAASFQTSLTLKDSNGIAKNEFSAGESITFELSITHLLNSAKTITLSDAQIYGILVGNGSVLSWIWPEGTVFAMMTQTLEFGPMETKTYSVTWNQKNSIGIPVLMQGSSYQAQGYIATNTEKNTPTLSSQASETRSALVTFTVK